MGEAGTGSVTVDRMRSLPRPRPEPEFYAATLEEGFRRFPARRENYARYRAAARGELVDYLPVRLDVENVSRCNFHCTMCQVSDWPGYQRAGDMSLEDYRALLDAQEGVVEIKLQGMGEPLLGACYAEMVAYARQRAIWVRSTTNGSLLHLQDNYKRVIDADICELQVSIDGATPQTYEAIRRGGRFAKVTENCLLLNRYCSQAGRRRTRMWAVAQAANFRELERFPALAASLGFDRLTFSLDLNDWGQTAWRQRNDPQDIHGRVDAALAEHLAGLGRAQGVEVTFWFIDEKYDPAETTKLCPWPFERVYVSSDMRIVPCCMIANPEVVDLGDARTLREAWNGDRMAAFRRAHLRGEIPDVCRSCYRNGAAETRA